MDVTPALQLKDSAVERMFLGISIILGAVLWLSFSLDRVHAEVPSASQASEVRAVAISGNDTVQATTVKKRPLLEMHIAPNGMALLRGVTVDAVSGTTIYVTAFWESGQFSWEVRTNPFTKFLNSKGEKEIPDEIHVGDVITITGTLGSGGVSPIIDADIVRIY